MYLKIIQTVVQLEAERLFCEFVVIACIRIRRRIQYIRFISVTLAPSMRGTQ